MRRAAVIAVVVAASSVAAAEPPVIDATAQPFLRKGPWLQRQTSDAITVMWQLEPPQPSTLILTGPGGEQRREVAAAPIALATIGGLAPASRYTYRIEAGAGRWSGELATAPAIGADVPFTFLVMGDSRDGIEPHRRVVARMATETADFVVGTGDMVDDGRRDDLWQEFFDIEGPMFVAMPYYPCLGNHDREGKEHGVDKFRALFAVPAGGAPDSRYYAFTYAMTRFIVLDSNLRDAALADETTWLAAQLVAARADPKVRHIFPVMHHPTFSISLHGGSERVRTNWMPLFEQYRVTAVLSGHDHVYERAENNGLRYFVSGGGGAPLYRNKTTPNPIDIEAVKRIEKAHHFLRVRVAGSRIEVTSVRSDGTIIEKIAWTDFGIVPPPGIVPDLPKPPPPVPVSPPPPKTTALPAPAPTSTPRIALLGIGLLVLAGGVVARMLRRET